MIPLKDDAPRFSTPYINYFLMAANIAVFIYQLTLPMMGGQAYLASFIRDFGLVPIRVPIWISGGDVPVRLVNELGTRYISAVGALLPILTSMFLHGSWMHIISNIRALYIFGDNVEAHFGHFGYLGFYLLGGVLANIAHVVVNFYSPIPSVGASGAIACVMGAYFVLYPSARVLLWFLPIFFLFLWIPAWLVLGYWFIVQFLSGAATAITSTATARGGIAFWAHIGGFIAGVILVKIFPARPRRYSYYGR
jgi:membrane associated rhomboid family serine protease